MNWMARKARASSQRDEERPKENATVHHGRQITSVMVASGPKASWDMES